MNNDINKLDEYFSTTEKGKIYPIVIKHIEKALIEKALERSFGNQLKAAKILGINRNTLRAKIKKMKIDVERFKL